MKYNLYFGHHLLIIADSACEGYEIKIDDLSIDRVVEIFENHQIIYLCDPDPQSCFDLFARQFIFVEAAGGVVQSRGRDLLIFRNGRWDIPKGHRELGESIEQCALREVEEETGVSGISIHNYICSTLHFYLMKGRWELKKSSWYAMEIDNEPQFKPQTEEGIERVEWIGEELIEATTIDSFPTVRSVLEQLHKVQG